MSKDRQVTVSEFAVDLPQDTSRDANNIERTWRRHKALHLLHNPRLLSRLLGRKV